MRPCVAWGLASAVLALTSATPAVAHEGSANYRSTVRSLSPPVDGVDIQVVNYDDRLLLVNRTGRDVEVRGYDGEPYIRIGADGAVRVNKRSPSYYLNLERFGEVAPPPEAREAARPRWELVGETGRFEWHDHRIHYMSKSAPSQVADTDKRTKVFDWQIPFEVGGKRVVAKGDLFWVPSAGGGLPRGALIALAVLVIGGIVFVEAIRRRRRTGVHHSGGSRAWG